MPTYTCTHLHRHGKAPGQMFEPEPGENLEQQMFKVILIQKKNMYIHYLFKVFFIQLLFFL